MATWLITGCSTGLGRALASAALDRGETVVVTARDEARAAQAIIAAVRSPATPRLLVLVPDALTRFRDAMKELSAEVNAWEQTSLSTSF